ncbi:DNA-packaging protein [Enterococcus hirae]
MVPKFRAWDKNNNKMISWRYLLNGYNLRNVFMRTEMCGLVLMQSTGLKDKNGVEIYSGDIGWDVYGEEYGQVVLENGCFVFESVSVSRKLSDVVKDIEIVGHIYQNSDLLFN